MSGTHNTNILSSEQLKAGFLARQAQKNIPKETSSSVNLLQTYPNPSSGIFNLSVINEGDIRLQINDALGRLISDQIVQSGSTIDLSGKPGFYIINAFDLNGNEIGTCRQLILK